MYLGIILAYCTIILIVIISVGIFLIWQIDNRRNEVYQEKSIIEAAYKDFEKVEKKNLYLSKRGFQKWLQAHIETKSPLEDIINFEKYLEMLSKFPDFLKQKALEYFQLDEDYHTKCKILIRLVFEGEEYRKERNEIFIANELELYQQYFDTVESNPLTEEQRKSIIINEAHNLIVAGAGTGKTSTLVGKTGYLLSKESFSPEDLLLLSFANLPKLEMRTRVSEKLDCKLETRTFHSLGLEILRKTLDVKPNVASFADDNTKYIELIENLLRRRMQDIEFANKINRYFVRYLVFNENNLAFESDEEYEDFLDQKELRTLNGDLVKSYAECDIANYLFLKGINYEYEALYVYDTADEDHQQYKPDFYLPEYNIWIEHFGIDRQGNTAPEIDPETYQKAMSWKRDKHKEKRTTLIETFTYERSEGTLIENLEWKLDSKKVEQKPVSEEMIYERLIKLGTVTKFSGLLGKFITLFKSKNEKIQVIRENARSYRYSKRYLAFLDIFETIYEGYENLLKEYDQIDFHDMINLAIEQIRDGNYESKFKYILVDEYQDISHTRFKFLKALLNAANDTQLFCVGDDWQSIYRFTGSDITLMTDFESRFPYNEIMYLTRTFRFNQDIRDISSEFIMKNPEQYTKDITARQSEHDGVTIVWYEDHDDALHKTLELIDSFEEVTAKVQVLSRYSRRFYEELGSTGWIFRNRKVQNNYEDFSVDTFVKHSTIHSSKGSEEDYVILIGVKGSTWGFPCLFEDDPVLKLVLSVEDLYPNAEERRLFYVALTRAKKQAFVLADRRNLSKFVVELVKDNPSISMIGESPFFGLCSKCGDGLVHKTIQKGKPVFRCKNYSCRFEPPICPECENGFLKKNPENVQEYICINSECTFNVPKCPTCDGYQINMNGKFWRCSNSWSKNCKYQLFITPEKTPVREYYDTMIIDIPASLPTKVKFNLEKIRKKHAKAYEKWTNEEDQRLIYEFNQGMSIPEMMKTHQRQQGGIMSRLKKLELVN